MISDAQIEALDAWIRKIHWYRLNAGRYFRHGHRVFWSLPQQQCPCAFCVRPTS